MTRPVTTWRSLIFLVLLRLRHWSTSVRNLLVICNHLRRRLALTFSGPTQSKDDEGRRESKAKSTRNDLVSKGLPGSPSVIQREQTGKGTKAAGGPGLDVVTICESRRPLSALDLHHLDHPNHGQFLQPGDIPTRPSSMVLPGQSPVHSTQDMLHPYSYAHSNGSKVSHLSTDVNSTSELAHHRGRRLGVAHPRPEGRATSRAAARGISRVASRAPSRATSCSRQSRAPSRSPAPSMVDLPLPAAAEHPRPHSSAPAPQPPSHIYPPHLLRPRSPAPAPVPQSPARQTIGSRQSIGLPHGDVVEPGTGSVPSISLPRETIYPVMAIPRYDQYATISPEGGGWLLDPVTTHFTIEDVPHEWVPCTHPEGRLYFYHPQKRIYTDCDVRDPQILVTIKAFAWQVSEMVAEQGLVLPANYDLVLFLEERQVSGGYNWLYYFADNVTRSLFWIQECHPNDELEIGEITAFRTAYDVKYEIEAKYWQHVEMYPHGHSISTDIFNELTGILLFASVDCNTSMTTTVTYRPDEVHRMLGLIKTAKGIENTDYTTASIGRLMNIWIHNRFLNFHGQTHARLGRDQSVYNTVKTRRTPLIRVLAPLFWNAPEVHLRGLERIWTDGIIAIIPWGGFIGKLQNEWQEFVLYATVLLNANVAFLAIPSVDTGDGHVTATQISSYLSIVTSVGCILVGLLLIRQHRVKSKETAEEANRFLSSRKHEMLGLETLAIIYSLPYALLMWGMLTFLLAFSFECFGSGVRTSIFLTAAGWIAVAILVGWTIFTGWESGESSRPVSNILMDLVARVLPGKEAEESEGGAEGNVAGEAGSANGVVVVDEKAEARERKWWNRVLPRNRTEVFPHARDPPTATPGGTELPNGSTNV